MLREDCSPASGRAPSSQHHATHPRPGRVFRLSLVRHGQTNHNRLRLLQGQMNTQLNEFGREQASLLARYLKRVGIYHDQIYTSDLSRAYETSKIIISGASGAGNGAGAVNGEPKRAPSQLLIKRNCLLRERSYGKLQGLPMAAVRELAAAAAAAAAAAENSSSAPQVAPPAAPANTPVAVTHSHHHHHHHHHHQRHQNIINHPNQQQQRQQQQQHHHHHHHQAINPSWGPASKIHRPEGGETLDEVRARVETFCDQVLFPSVSDQQRVLVVSHGGTIREFMKLFTYKYGAQIKFQDLVMTPNTGVNEFDIWLNERNQVEQIRTNHLHKLPHLTFDVFNRDNPHVNLNNLHLRTSSKGNGGSSCDNSGGGTVDEPNAGRAVYSTLNQLAAVAARLECCEPAIANGVGGGGGGGGCTANRKSLLSADGIQINSHQAPATNNVVG